MPTYTYRRELKREDWIRVAGAAAAAGVGMALTTAYLTRIFLQRTPLRALPMEPVAPPAARVPAR